MVEIRTPSHRDIVIGISERMRAARGAAGEAREVVLPAPALTGAVAPAKPVERAVPAPVPKDDVVKRAAPNRTKPVAVETVDLPPVGIENEGAADGAIS